MSVAAASRINSTLNDGYHFYKNVLKAPKYVVAPMVAQSELAWRMLARNHGAQLCYTPMCSALSFLRDKSYQKQVLKDISCIEDRPLIVQFCANSVDTFVSASALVEKYCDGVDLNLGCPQHIAQRGLFGAYMQDDWELLHDMISHARKCLRVAVTAKIRVFPEISKTVEYAKMLENAGCLLLTVHGRTREQKRLNTGIASWEHIKAVKNNISIPVFANGNIRYGSDVERCLEETGVDGVMAAEGHLTNPLIFKGLHPNVFDVIDEYLSITEQYPTSMPIIRTHLFNLLSRVFQRHPCMMNMLANTSKMEIVLGILKRLKKKVEELDIYVALRYNFLRTMRRVYSYLLQDFLIMFVNRSTDLKRCPALAARGEKIHYRVELQYDTSSGWDLPNRREKIKIENTSALAKTDIPEGMSRSKWKQMLRDEIRLKNKLKKRKEEHIRRKERQYEMERKLLDEGGVLKSRVLRMMDRKQAVLDRLSEAMKDDRNTITVCLDLTWCNSMNSKEINKLSSQLGRLYGSNRKSEKPAHLYFAGFERSGVLWDECVRKHNGFEEYKIDMTPLSYHELFNKDDIIYLTPDSPTALESVQPGTIYVLGGLVDETVTKKLTLNLANKAGIKTRRLPVPEYMSRSGRHSNYSTVFCVNQVFDILLNYHVTGDWKQALSAGVPPRKGYVFDEDS